MSATENRSEENSPASARKGERTRASCPAFCSLLLSWLMQKASRAAKSLGRRATGGRSERREALQPFSTPITPASHPTPRGPCMYGDFAEGQRRQGPGVRWGRRTSCSSLGERAVGGSGGESEVGTSGRGSSGELWKQWHLLCLKTAALRRSPAKQEMQNRKGPCPPAAHARSPCLTLGPHGL